MLVPLPRLHSITDKTINTGCMPTHGQEGNPWKELGWVKPNVAYSCEFIFQQSAKNMKNPKNKLPNSQAEQDNKKKV